MPTDTERRLEALENLLLIGGGVAAGVGSTIGLQSQLGRQLARRGAVAAPGVIGRAATRHPVTATAAILLTARTLGLSTMETAELIAEEMAIPAIETLPIITPGAVRREKRKISKANKAVKHAMSLLRGGTKASTGADKGKLPKGAFKIAVKAAGLANPGTKSVIGKGKSTIKNLARKLKKWWK